MSNKMNSVAFINPSNRINSGFNTKYSLYNKEKKALKNAFEKTDRLDWGSNEMQEKLNSFAKQVMDVTVDVSNQEDLISSLLPTEQVDPGDTYVFRELHGMNVYFGSYGAAVKMSRPQFSQYTAVPNLKEVGIKLQLSQIQTGKYSASELGEYTANLITAWRNRLLFVNTLAGMTAYTSGGAQHTAGTNLGIPTLLTSLDTLSDEAEMRVIVGRRNAIHQLSDQSGWSNSTKLEWETKGQVGTFAGVPVIKVNSFTDQDYGTVYPFPKDELWIFSELPAGRIVMAGALRTSSETILSNETLNMYYRFDDGIGIFHTDRIARIETIT